MNFTETKTKKADMPVNVKNVVILKLKSIIGKSI